ncbi:unnamed protein product [Toxocara canis]|uniref:Secreted protein n=1 Tax=Toxocara canis TaxID=6265 RepID=A0A183TWE9_TOXCA|nr:unnamed protein product [Toxocara canis]
MSHFRSMLLRHKSFVFLSCLIMLVHTGGAKSSDKALQLFSSKYDNFRTFEPTDSKAQRTVIDKKYDRNCFFSPVQCMLWRNQNSAEHMIWSRGI